MHPLVSESQTTCTSCARNQLTSGGTTRAIAKGVVDALKIGKGSETAATYLTVQIGG